MSHTTRRLFALPLLFAVLVTGLFVEPALADAGVAATVSVTGPLRLRALPSLSSPIVATVRDKQRITIQCAVTGTRVIGKVRTTNLWDRLSTGRYISYAYVLTTGTIALCPKAAAPPKVAIKSQPAPASKYTLATIRSADGSVNVRVAALTTSAVVGVLANGAKVNLVCGVAGPSVLGTVRTSTQWDRTSSGTYITHAYVVSAALPLCPGATVTPTSSVALSSADFLALAIPAGQVGWRQFGVPPSVTIAQAILESGWGRSALSTIDQNYFGIKCFNSVYGKFAKGCHVYTTTECTKVGSCFSTVATFRSYTTMTNSFRDHGSFLTVNSRYKPAFAYTRNANLFIWNVWKAGYATDPNYYTKITGVIAANNLYRYDTWK